MCFLIQYTEKDRLLLCIPAKNASSECNSEETSDKTKSFYKITDLCSLVSVKVRLNTETRVMFQLREDQRGMTMECSV